MNVGPARHATRSAFAAVLGLALAAATLTACGHDHHHDNGLVVVDNQTQTTTNEMLLTFRVAPFQLPFTGDLLNGMPIDPGGARFIGEFGPDYYDAEGDLELGQIIEWFDEFVGHGDTTFFVVL